MRKTLLFLMLVMLILVVVAGCNTSAQSSNSQSGNYYVPAGNGCGVEGPEPIVNNEVGALVSNEISFKVF